MHERFRQLMGSGLLRRPLLVLAGAAVGFVAVVGVELHPPDPEARLPGSQRLAALIQRTQQENNEQKAQVAMLQAQVNDLSAMTQSRKQGNAAISAQLGQAGVVAGARAMAGPGFVVTLNDSSLKQSPTGNVNDLVIHSLDVQAVVNGMWASGAEAIAVNGERLVSTSAVLCVGNTLLINGAVFSPPYQITAIGADRSKFTDDQLVRQLRSDANRFSLQFAVGHDQSVQVPAYSGPETPKYAQVGNS
jgi:uncharacterized protein YlxW (UPF0749 family)